MIVSNRVLRLMALAAVAGCLSIDAALAQDAKPRLFEMRTYTAPEGKLDAKALYGQQGGGGGGDGFGLSMSGWAWADNPQVPELPDNEDGRIEFEIECDENGDIIGIQTIQRGLSPRAEQLLKEEIRKNSLVRTSAGKAPERSKGRVVFILKTK